MKSSGRSAGFSLIELLVAMTLLGFVSMGLANLMVQNSRINRSQQMTADVQANARNTLSVVVQALRSAGWDPLPANIPTVELDPDTGDNIDQIEIFADLNGDGLTNQDGEQILIRHDRDRLEWRRSAGGAFTTLAANISNDADGDGLPELMFTPLPNPNPTRIRVQVTARSSAPDPVSGEFIRYTVASDVALRKELS